MNENIITLIINADISRPVKEEILKYWLLPSGNETRTPFQKSAEPSRVGSIKRPTKEQLDLKANPRKAEEIKEMEETLDNVDL